MNVLHLNPPSRPALWWIVVTSKFNIVVVVYRSRLYCASLFDYWKEKLVTFLNLLEFVSSCWVLIWVIPSGKLSIHSICGRRHRSKIVKVWESIKKGPTFWEQRQQRINSTHASISPSKFISTITVLETHDLTGFLLCILLLSLVSNHLPFPLIETCSKYLDRLGDLHIWKFGLITEISQVKVVAKDLPS